MLAILLDRLPGPHRRGNRRPNPSRAHAEGFASPVPAGRRRARIGGSRALTPRSYRSPARVLRPSVGRRGGEWHRRWEIDFLPAVLPPRDRSNHRSATRFPSGGWGCGRLRSCVGLTAQLSQGSTLIVPAMRNCQPEPCSDSSHSSQPTEFRALFLDDPRGLEAVYSSSTYSNARNATCACWRW